MNKQKITTAVFPVGGLGTRFLPITKVCPKEMLPIVDKPLIQYVVEEAIQAGIQELIFVTSHAKRSIEDYFDHQYNYEYFLKLKGKDKALETILNIIPEKISIAYIRQSTPKGLGDAVLCAKTIVGNKPFAVLLADDIVDSETSCLQEMVNVYEKTGASILAVESIPREKTNQYGIISLDKEARYTNQISAIVEKPHPQKAPSQLGVIGRYILSPRIFDFLETIAPGIGGEIQLTDAISNLLQETPVIAHPIKGKRFDCGNKLGFIEATITFALRNSELDEKLREKLIKILS